VLEVFERKWNQARFPQGARRVLGVITVLLVLGLAAGAGFAITQGATHFEPASHAYGSVLLALIATAGLAQRSLYEHVKAVESALISGQLDDARLAVGRIVGRDTAALSPAEVSAAAIESLAESFNDAVVAPAFWLLVGGLPGLFAYKALNTADSMIGHIEPRWRAFGWAAARLDDLANFVPARIAGVLLALVAGRGFSVMWRDAPRHASPNAGWPEAAAAGALGLRLGGPTSYDGVMHVRPHFGDGASPQAADLTRALGLYRKGCMALWLLLALVAITQVLL
jgi:adenosylcobinamide-phosphate synthase